MKSIDWKKVIVEELEELKLKKFIQGFYTYLKSQKALLGEYNETNKMHFEKFCRYTNTKVGYDPDNEFIGKVFSILINNKGRSLKDFDYTVTKKQYHVDIEIDIQYAFGTIEKNGVISAYFKEHAQEKAENNVFLYDESTDFELYRDLHYDEYQVNVSVEEDDNSIIKESEENEFDKNSFYLEYITNLLPESLDFKIHEEEGKIIIDLPKK